MNLVEISESIHRDAVWVVFANVLLQQLGLPIPAVPTLMLAGSLALSYGFAGKVLAAAILASVVADWIWYVAGRAYGYGLLVGLCKLSINPGVCVTSAESLFSRWGAWALVGAKFVPGFSTVGPPIAGSLRLPLPTFMLAAGIGAGLWAGVAIFVGWLFRTEVHMVIETLSSNGMTTLGIATLIIVVWLAWKFWQRHRFERLARIPHISATELKAQREAGGPLLVLDLRGASATGRAPSRRRGCTGPTAWCARGCRCHSGWGPDHRAARRSRRRRARRGRPAYRLKVRLDHRACSTRAWGWCCTCTGRPRSAASMSFRNWDGRQRS